MNLTRKLDWKPTEDERNANFLFQPREAATTSKFWDVAEVLDQGELGGCVGYGWSGALGSLKGLGARGRQRVRRDAHAKAMYMLATDLDDIKGEWPTEDTGSSVLGGAKAAKDLGYIISYAWLVDAAGIQNAIRTTGPVVIGIPWYNSMFSPEEGQLVVDPTSGLAGGHCVFLYGVFVDGVMALRNSWGVGWGNGGSVKITPKDLDILMADHGEACVPTPGISS